MALMKDGSRVKRLVAVPPGADADNGVDHSLDSDCAHSDILNFPVSVEASTVFAFLSSSGLLALQRIQCLLRTKIASSKAGLLAT